MTLLDHALDYYRRGWCVIPIIRGTKKAACKWKKMYVDQRPTEDQMHKWFALPHVGGMAVLLGPVSGHLYCRDFDKQDSIDAWTAKHPDLAATLPIVQSMNGIHVYFTSPQPWRVKDMGDGELRGIGGYCMLPPSIHPDGIPYTWKNPPPPGSIPQVNPITAGMANKWKQCCTEPDRAVQRPDRGRAEPDRSRGKKVVGGLPPITEDQAIASALPTEKHQNDAMLFNLARSVLAMEQQRGSVYSTAELVALFDKWHSRNEHLRPDETRDDYWTKFMRAYHNAIVPMGADPVAIAYQKALTIPPPEIATQYTDPKRRLLVSICRELQRMAGDQSFYLSCRVTQQALDLPCPSTANNWMNGLVTCKILRVTAKGGPHNNKANRYRYLPPLD